MKNKALFAVAAIVVLFAVGPATANACGGHNCLLGGGLTGSAGAYADAGANGSGDWNYNQAGAEVYTYVDLKQTSVVGAHASSFGKSISGSSKGPATAAAAAYSDAGAEGGRRPYPHSHK